MRQRNVHQGWLKAEEVEEGHETVTLDGEPIADELSYISSNIVTVRYYISDKEATEEELSEDFLINTLYGSIQSDYGARYSEYTGYLWTDDELKVGGHDILSELENYDGKFLYLIVELDQKAYDDKQKAQNERLYKSYLDSLVHRAKVLQKNKDEVVSDIIKLWN